MNQQQPLSTQTQPTEEDIFSFLAAARNGHLETLQTLYSHYGSSIIEATDKTSYKQPPASTVEAPQQYLLKCTALQWAAHYNRKECLQFLIENNAQLETKDSDGLTALMGAARSDATLTLTVLLENGADKEARDNNGVTPLIWAARSDAPGSTEILIAHGVNIDARQFEGGWTALMYAAVNAHSEIVHILLKHNANHEMTNRQGIDALMMARGSTKETEACVLALETTMKEKHEEKIELIRKTAEEMHRGIDKPIPIPKSRIVLKSPT